MSDLLTNFPIGRQGIHDSSLKRTPEMVNIVFAQTETFCLRHLSHKLSLSNVFLISNLASVEQMISLPVSIQIVVLIQISVDGETVRLKTVRTFYLSRKNRKSILRFFHHKNEGLVHNDVILE